MFLFRPSRTTQFLLSLLVNQALSQACWYPDGVTQAQSDVACDSTADVSACCGPNAFCLSDGLCYINGAVSRGSCTDQNWGPECAQYCADVLTDSGVLLQSCDPSQNTFTCGVLNDSCTSSSFVMDGGNTIILRPDQVEEGSGQLRRINPTSTFAAQSSMPASSDTFSTVDMIGVGVGVGIPLLAALAATVFIIISQKRKLKVLRSENKLTKGDSGFSSPAYAHTVPVQAPHSAYGIGFEYQPLTHSRPQGHFQELVVNELDANRQPQELASAKPR